MKTEQKIYLVTTGSYDEYSICAAFSSEEKASEWIKREKLLNNVYINDAIEEILFDPEPASFELLASR